MVGAYDCVPTIWGLREGHHERPADEARELTPEAKDAGHRPHGHDVLPGTSTEAASRTASAEDATGERGPPSEDQVRSAGTEARQNLVCGLAQDVGIVEACAKRNEADVE